MTAGMQDGFWLGVDVGKFGFDVCVAPRDARTSDWAKLRVASFTHDANGIRLLEKWLGAALGKGPCLGVCIESTGVYSHRFVQAIEDLGLPEVAMVNPALPVAFRKSMALRDKCDRVDAAVLALYGVVHRPQPNTRRDPVYAQLRTLYRAYEQYDEDLRRFENRLEQCMDESVRKDFRKTIA
ncbi:MAG: transposase, partial [Candidatus Hydrogenedentes bacterium]|nr:transposase [Candidatus Hydrogenedentota bacterium]